MRHLVVIVAMSIAGFAAGVGYGFGHEVAADPPPLPSMVYDCRHRHWDDPFVVCICLEGQETRTCSFGVPKGHYTKPIAKK